jgi:hypothetical protein
VTARHLSLTIWEQAARQIEEANDWWREHRQASPDALTEDLARAFDLVSRQPGVGTPAICSSRTRVSTRKPSLERPDAFALRVRIEYRPNRGGEG